MHGISIQQNFEFNYRKYKKVLFLANSTLSPEIHVISIYMLRSLSWINLYKLSLSSFVLSFFLKPLHSGFTQTTLTKRSLSWMSSILLNLTASSSSFLAYEKHLKQLFIIFYLKHFLRLASGTTQLLAFFIFFWPFLINAPLHLQPFNVLMLQVRYLDLLPLLLHLLIEWWH